MKYFFCLAFVFAVAPLGAQETGRNADEVLTRLLQRLASQERVSYHYYREIRYFADNYHNISEADMYLEFPRNQPWPLRFRSVRPSRRSVFNGTSLLLLDDQNKTIDTMAARSSAALDNNSDLYHSFAMLKNILPRVIGNDSIRRFVSDTLVQGKTYTCVTLEGEGMYFGTFSGLIPFTTKGLRRPYYLLLDKTTGLPYQLATRYIRNGDDRDFVTVTYTSINTHPPVPTEATWYYPAYTNVYKHLAPPVRIPLVKPGAEIAGFRLPAYTQRRTDSIGWAQYRGKVVLLDFWFKSCGPCMEAMPKYNALQDRFGKQGFNLITVNIEDGMEDIKFFYNKHHPNYPMLFNGIKVFEKLGLRGCPSSVLVDRNGKVIRVFQGFDEEQIASEIQKAL